MQRTKTRNDGSLQENRLKNTTGSLWSGIYFRTHSVKKLNLCYWQQLCSADSPIQIIIAVTPDLGCVTSLAGLNTYFGYVDQFYLVEIQS